MPGTSAKLAKWTRAGAGIIAGSPPTEEFEANPRQTWTHVELVDAQPGRFIKQVVTMFLSIAPPGFVWHDNLALAEFVQDPEQVGLPSRYQFYLGLYRGPYARFVGGPAVALNVETAEVHVLLEIAYPPFSYVLSLDEKTPAVPTANLSSFANLRIDQSCTVEMDLINGFGHNPPCQATTRHEGPLSKRIAWPTARLPSNQASTCASRAAVLARSR